MNQSGDQVAEQFIVDLLQFLRSSKLYTDLLNAAQVLLSIHCMLVVATCRHVSIRMILRSCVPKIAYNNYHLPYKSKYKVDKD